MSAERKGHWMQTVSGRAYWPIDPRPEEVFIEDIAHALGMQCRYTGHCLRFYSVAEHCVHVSTVVPPQYALIGLLHDAAEAYLADIARPVKGELKNYAEIEDLNWRAIASRFSVSSVFPAEVKAADNAVLFAEQAVLMAPSPLPGWGMGAKEAPAEVKIRCLPPTGARDLFLKRFKQLT